MTHTHRHAHRHPHGNEEQTKILDLEATVLAAHTDAIIARLPLQRAPHRILDLGSGTGAGTFALTTHFPQAYVTAVDSSPEHLERLREKARDTGLSTRVATVRADLDETIWPDLAAPDLVWASASLHHMAEPERTLRKVYELLRPGGLFVVVEPAGFPRFLPEDAPARRPGLEERCHAVTDRTNAEHMPHRDADWGAHLTDTGFVIEEEQTVTLRLEGAGDEAIAAYALAGLRRIRQGVAAELTTADLTTLDELLDTDGPHSILLRDDLVLRTERTVWITRRQG